MTLVVLGLDALDAALLEDFDHDTYRLSTHGEMQSVAYMFDDRPHTGEVWPTVATGLHPREHGITGSTESNWSNPLIELGSRLLEPFDLQMSTRNKLGDIVEETTGASWELATVSDPTFFDEPGRLVHNWPGVYRNEELHRIWEIIEDGVRSGEDNMPREVYERKVKGIAAEQFGWVREMLNHDASLVASHIHVLDAFGHAFSDDRESMRRSYEWCRDRVEEILDAMDDDDELLILSDHGMETTWTNGQNEHGTHSWRAFSASTFDTRPEDVHDVKSWVEAHVEDVTAKTSELNLPEEQLRQLGYID